MRSWEPQNNSLSCEHKKPLGLNFAHEFLQIYLLVFSYKPLEGALEEIARDYHPNWMTCIKVIDDDTYIGAENSENIFICARVELFPVFP